MAIFISRILSLLFHPMLILLYIFLFGIATNPFFFGFHGFSDKVVLMLFVFFTGFFIPLLSILMMRALNLIPDLSMREKRQRIFPYIATGIFYLWLLINVWNNPDIPVMLRGGVLGVVIALFLSFFINNFERLSAHAAGMGSLSGFVLIAGVFFSLEQFSVTIRSSTIAMDWVVVFALVFLMSGAVGTARLILKKHQINELIPGYFVGFMSQWIAFFILNR